MFKGDKLVGLLDGEEAKLFLFITNQIKAGSLVETFTSETSTSNIALNIYDNKTNIQPKYEYEKVHMDIKTNTTSVLQEWGMTEGLTEERINDVKKLFENALQKDIENLIEKVQNEYGCDIFGFGQALMKNNPQLWREIEKDWEQVFVNLEVNVETNIEIINTNFLVNSIKVGD